MIASINEYEKYYINKENIYNPYVLRNDLLDEYNSEDQELNVSVISNPHVKDIILYRGLYKIEEEDFESGFNFLNSKDVTYLSVDVVHHPINYINWDELDTYLYYTYIPKKCNSTKEIFEEIWLADNIRLFNYSIDGELNSYRFYHKYAKLNTHNSQDKKEIFIDLYNDFNKTVLLKLKNNERIVIYDYIRIPSAEAFGDFLIFINYKIIKL
jgi:hypothetical protein